MYRLITSGLVLFIVLPNVIWADTLLSTSSYWQCSAHDSTEKQWIAKSVYERAATNQAYDGCKKQSKNPTSCKIAKEFCEYFANGKSNRAMWQCTALDLMAKPWVSNAYTQRDDAAIAAKAYCQEQSSMPDTCYINLLTCKNLNERG